MWQSVAAQGCAIRYKKIEELGFSMLEYFVFELEHQGFHIHALNWKGRAFQLLATAEPKTPDEPRIVHQTPEKHAESGCVLSLETHSCVFQEKASSA